MITPRTCRPLFRVVLVDHRAGVWGWTVPRGKWRALADYERALTLHARHIATGRTAVVLAPAADRLEAGHAAPPRR